MDHNQQFLEEVDASKMMALQHLKTKDGRDVFFSITDMTRIRGMPTEALLFSESPSVLQELAAEQHISTGSQSKLVRGEADVSLSSGDEKFPNGDKVPDNGMLQEPLMVKEKHQQVIHCSENTESDYGIHPILEDPIARRQQFGDDPALPDSLELQVEQQTHTPSTAPIEEEEVESFEVIELHIDTKTDSPTCHNIQVVQDEQCQQKEDLHLGSTEAHLGLEPVREIQEREDDLERTLPILQDPLKEENQINLRRSSRIKDILATSKNAPPARNSFTDSKTRRVKSLIGKIYKNECDICCRHFATKSKLKRHVNTVHTKAKKVFECEICGKLFRLKGSLKNHIDVVHGSSERHNCNLCGKTLSTEGNLKQHIDTVHRELKPYKCDHCSKSYGWKRNLRSHIESVHQMLRCANCEICGMAFLRKGHLEEHYNKVHYTVMPPKCDICGKNFSNKTYLNRHIDTAHFNIKPHCEICGKAFTQEGHLKDHYNKVHCKVNPYKCETCGKNYRNNRYLKRHIDTAHSNSFYFPLATPVHDRAMETVLPEAEQELQEQQISEEAH